MPVNPEYLLMKSLYFPLVFFNLVLTSPPFGPAVLCNGWTLSAFFTVCQLSEIRS